MVDIDQDTAFPFVSHGGIHEHQYISVGLSKRELLAAMAMHAHRQSNLAAGSGLVAVLALDDADALLAALCERAPGDDGKEA